MADCPPRDEPTAPNRDCLPYGSPQSSRYNRCAAGWGYADRRPYGTRWEKLMAARTRTRIGNFSWFSPAPLLASINDIIAKGLDDVVNAHRQGWLATQRHLRGDDLRIDMRRIGDDADEGGDHKFKDPRFLILGDPGEQDASQYAVIAPLLSVCSGGSTTGSDFLIIASDVIYPAGDVNDYIDGFYLPFEDYKPPILAIPGNHDWYDGLNGFMFHFCGAQPLPPTSYRAGSYTFVERMARRLWRKAARPDIPELLRYRSKRHSERTTPWSPAQPAPYFAIETEPLLIVCIDTGITGKLDREQGDWLRRVSQDPRPKILVTGKPIYVDNEYRPGPIVWGDARNPAVAREAEAEACRTVDDIVRNPAHDYVAVIGGDIHNYQRYSVTVRDNPSGNDDGTARRIEYITSGGGGAYLSATHRIGRIDLHHWSKPTALPDTVAPVTEDDFRCYPLRGDSLARFTHRSVLTIYGLLLIAIAVLAAATVALAVSWNKPQDLPDGPELWQTLVVAAAAVLFLPLTFALGAGFRRVCSMIGIVTPRGYRTFFAVLTTAAAVALTVAVVEWAFPSDWKWQVALTAVGLLVVPAVLILIAYLTREIGPHFTRVVVVALVPLAVAWALLDPALGSVSAVALWVAGSSAVLLALVLLINLLTRKRQGWLTFSWCILPIGATMFALLHFEILTWSDLWRAATSIGLLAAAVFIIWWWRAVIALLLLCHPVKHLDADQAVRYVADKLQTPVERPSAKSATLGLRQRVLANVLFSTRWAGKFISEAAEATRPPFFKSFLLLEVHDRTLRITAYGVTGYRDHEQDPSVEDCIEIPLRQPHESVTRRDTRSTPATAAQDSTAACGGGLTGATLIAMLDSLATRFGSRRRRSRTY